jgi:hypothetical protein
VLAEYLLVGFVLAATLIAFRHWRLGIALAILAGMVQDPLRKLAPGAPPIFVLASVPIWVAVYVSVLRGERGARGAIGQAHPRLAAAAGLFGASLLVPAFLTLQYGVAGLQLALLGTFGYLSPLLGVLVGFAFARTADDMRRLLVFYAVVTAVMLVGTPLEYLGTFPGWNAIGTEALGGLWVRTTDSGGVALQSGFFRSPDVMGWHAAAAVMLSLALAMQRGSMRDRLWLLVAAWGGVCLVLAGRRKMTMMPIVWAAILIIALVRSGRVKRAAAVVFAGAVVALCIYYASGEFDVHESYFVYAGSVTSEGPLRMLDSAWGSVWETYAQAGVLGLGLGAASQGARYLAVSGAESWQESGLSKILVELGLPGFLAAVFLVLRLVRSLQGVARSPVSRGAQGPFTLSLLGFVVANAACFIISHQVYSDAVVLSMTSIMLGAVLGAYRWTSAVPLSAPAANYNQWPQRRPAVPARQPV